MSLNKSEIGVLTGNQNSSVLDWLEASFPKHGIHWAGHSEVDRKEVISRVKDFRVLIIQLFPVDNFNRILGEIWASPDVESLRDLLIIKVNTIEENAQQRPADVNNLLSSKGVVFRDWGREDNLKMLSEMIAGHFKSHSKKTH